MEPESKGSMSLWMFSMLHYVLLGAFLLFLLVLLQLMRRNTE
jgi:hypothetical protein